MSKFGGFSLSRKKRLELNCPDCGQGPLDGPTAKNEYYCVNDSEEDGCTWYGATYSHGVWKNVKRTGISVVRLGSSFRPYKGTSDKLASQVKMEVTGDVALVNGARSSWEIIDE